MIHIRTYVTQLMVDNQLWSGPNIKAESWEEAEKYIEENGFGYLTIIGELFFSFNTFELN